MNFAPPKWITVAAEEALNTVGPNHYSHPRGRPRLRNAIKNFYGSQFNRDLNVDSEILITSGANEGKFYSASFWHQPYSPAMMCRPILCLHGFLGLWR